ncbi:MAG: CPBP family intramembrane glutamic endopeptidase [Dokdonella sp.]
MNSGFFRSIGTWLLCIACALAVLPMLDQLARHQLRRQMLDAASQTLGALTHADTPHRWDARSDNAIIAGRAFGTDDAQFADDGFHLRSLGDSIQIGMVLGADIDLTRFSQLEISLTAETSGSIAAIVGKSLQQAACQSHATPLVTGHSTLTINLRKIGWTCNGVPAPMPTRAAMLRLVIDMPAQSSTTLHSVRMRPNAQLNPESVFAAALPLLPDPRKVLDFNRELSRTAENSTSAIWPMLQLPLDARVEQSLLARDQVRGAIADALIVPRGDFPEVAAQAASWQPATPTAWSTRLPWILLGGYIIVLVFLRLKPPLDTRVRALLELIAATAIPLTMIIGGHIGDNPDPAVLGACVATLVFALSLLVGDAPAEPSSRTLKRGWWVALLTIGLTVGLILNFADGHITRELPDAGRMFRYLAWAAVQQFLICVIVAERIERICGSSRVALLGAALVFALLHTPNAMLMQLTFVAGLIWIWNWQRHRALLANIVAHAISGLLLAASLPAQWLHSAEVSARFFL